MKTRKKLIAVIIGALVVSTSLVGFTSMDTKEVNTLVSRNTSVNQWEASYKKPKYIFTFIGDGMSYVQLNAANIYQGVTEKGELNLGNLAVSQFPVCGSATTQDATSFCPDSASTATAISSGVKTHSGVIGYNVDKKTKPESITEKLKKDGYKIGIVSSVSIDHATPSAFYAHEVSRSNMYNIALQLADSGFDYFAGGSLVQPKGKNGDQEDAFEVIKEKGYTIADSKEEIMALNHTSEKVYAITPTIQDSQAMNYDMDATSEELRLKDFVEKGIEVLDSEEGFFMMVEGGKIDWAGHANDARANIGDVLALDEAIQVAVDFAKEHPEETLILVTGDHETGGMSIGYATTGYDTTFDILENQKMSYVEFNKLINEYKKITPSANAKLEDLLPLIEENFGLVANEYSERAKNPQLVLTDYEYNKLEKAFEETMKDKADRTKNQETGRLYGGYEPLSVTLTHILNNKAGIGWTSYAHTGVPVPVYVMGQGEELFTGAYDNTDIFNKLVEICGLK